MSTYATHVTVRLTREQALEVLACVRSRKAQMEASARPTTPVRDLVALENLIGRELAQHG